MVRSRVFGILAGSEDQNDHDTLRTDPVFKLITNRSHKTGGKEPLMRLTFERTDGLTDGVEKKF